MKIFHNISLVTDVKRQAISNLAVVGTDRVEKQIATLGTTEKRALAGIVFYYKEGFQDVLVSAKLSQQSGFYFLENIPLSVIGNKISEIGLCEKQGWKPSSVPECFILDKNNKLEISVKSQIEIPIDSIFCLFDTYRIP
ncbi:MAG: hypothetical protein IPO06_29545 [Leptospiraceae bacterium]|nr:hypothetical protein [Leptospiraceae bacterium]MBP6738348.1 hypothetical protein [Leptospiraceae bacterium]